MTTSTRAKSDASEFDKHIAIIGSHGRMGGMLLERATQKGLSIQGLDLPLAETDLERVCRPADIVILCVPARHLKATAKKVTEHMRANATLADITSVKELPMRQMREVWTGNIVGTHPLFGPSARPGNDLPVAITTDNATTRPAVEDVKKFFKKIDCRVFECSPEKHDKAMACIQNMNFITNLAYFSLLANQPDLLPFLTPSFLRRKNAAAKMLTEDADMFAGLFEANPHSHAAVRQFRKMLNVAAAGDLDLLTRKARWWWPEFNKDSGTTSGQDTSQTESPLGKAAQK